MKQNILNIDTILEYLDQPQLFTARDGFGTMYLCLLYDDDRYTAIRISSSRLEQFEHQQVDLLSLFAEPENAEEYFDVSASADGMLTYSELKGISEDRLPSAGFFLTAPAHEKVTVTIPTKDKSLFSSVARRFGWVAM